VTGPARRVALVTGAGRGIGRATAIALAGAGTSVVVTARSTDELDAVVSEIAATGGEAAALVSDLTDRAQSTTLVERAASAFGPVDILVNNAGIGSSADPRLLAEFRDPFWDETLELNLTAPYLLSKAALPHMREQRWGRIVTVASINGRIPTPYSGAYVASKHGVIGLMRVLALEHAAEGITVNCVCPGPVRTRVNDARIAFDAQRLGRTAEDYEQGLTPIGGRLEPEDIAPMVVYLASDAARMITGQAYNVDGGVNMA
jgi:NAD(P)-dependent dehydrogenase (short-subunit alcohol dehydrogenase family)